MAATTEARRLTEAHRLAQARLGAQVVSQSRVAWRLLDPTDLDRTAEPWLTVMVPLVRSARQTSARLAANYLTTFRALELGVDSARYTPNLAEDLPLAQITTSLVVTGPAAVKAGMTRGHQLVKAVEIGELASSGAAMRHTLNGGRETITTSVSGDRKALGWARATSGKPCDFCAMLAGNGPVYTEATVDFEAHDHCSCSAEPVYRQDAAWPAGSQAFHDIWQESTRGLSGDDARSAFRQALQARR